ncbi:MAG: alpha-L-fucosidase [Candidatus Symbiothrix sp.]|jgi:alpha-L-fucosidase|nr:alpha-L-fucosidase [Candidatus Symbiothrix sp.]
MKRIIPLLLVLTLLPIFSLCLALSLMASPVVEAQTTKPDHSWFEEARFGLFVHFGPYSTLGDGEWIMNNKPFTVQDYHKLQSIFNPQLFDARQWVATAKAAGMKYITFTSRHHDSFSNWDTRQSDWNIMNTPYGKDLVRQLADECHKEGIKLVLYYSLADWSRDDYSYTTGRTGQNSGRTVQGDWINYIHFMEAQLTELLTNYGEIAGIWFDGEWDQLPSEDSGIAVTHEMSKVDWHFGEIYDLIHSLQPNCMISNNHHLAVLPGEDYQAFEKDLPGENVGGGFAANQKVTNSLPLETCETMNNTWGYNLRDNNFKSTKQIIHLLVKAAGYGANLLLNVGPKPTGEFESIAVSRLQEVGQWTGAYSETIYGTKGGFVKPQSWGAITQKGNTYYIHILTKEANPLTLAFPKRILSAEWLNVDSKLQWKQDKKTNSATFSPDGALDEVDSIIKVIVKD